MDPEFGRREEAPANACKRRVKVKGTLVCIAMLRNLSFMILSEIYRSPGEKISRELFCYYSESGRFYGRSLDSLSVSSLVNPQVNSVQ